MYHSNKKPISIESRPLLPIPPGEPRSRRYGLKSIPYASSLASLWQSYWIQEHLIAVVMILFTIITFTSLYAHLTHADKVAVVLSEFAPPGIQNSWGAYTPYFPVKPYVPPPPSCKITQVNIIQRHGARFPTSGSTTRIQAVLAKLQSAALYTNPDLFFLKNYKYTLGANDLVSFGAYQSAQAGQEAYIRYRNLVSKGNIPFVRASGSSRVVDSANNWTTGFAEASSYVFRPVLSVILPEHLNDTLDDAMCPAAGDSTLQTSAWASIFGAAIAARLNAQAVGANLTSADVADLMPLCAFESVSQERLSDFCRLFTAEEWGMYEYWSDLDKFYGTGYGQPLGPVQGVGYINELLSRLTGQPVHDNTQTNHTLDASPETFPLDRSIYVDFSHDNLIVAVITAMGLFKQPKPLDPANPDPARTWITSHLVPFGGRMVIERVQCADRSGDPFLRVLVNDALQPLDFCGADNDGLCALEKFVDSQGYARNDGDGDFEKCFEV